ncbi:uncharacterized protein N7500_007879 [Penicillium coprophilum]|uniref:uncharacterized protein n=1 Tax=Penicillium coprophilum TaxID=36646 RepID=UPI002385985F|nr:uncharacterized protein N7500_007879 [Penicillium coprophilum]KAJ5158228.1 hypothetical protein N7500_007879 [Penicillium coprophilum]
MSTEQSNGGFSNAHADEHGSAGDPASPDAALAAVPPRQAQIEAPPEKEQASRSIIFPVGGLTGHTDMYDAGELYKPSDSDRRFMITDILRAPDDPNTIQRAWEKNIPDSCNLNYKQLMAILHPGRVPTSDKADAEKAFQENRHRTLLLMSFKGYNGLERSLTNSFLGRQTKTTISFGEEDLRSQRVLADLSNET